jgi:hypothetical protein
MIAIDADSGSVFEKRFEPPFLYPKNCLPLSVDFCTVKKGEP